MIRSRNTYGRVWAGPAEGGVLERVPTKKVEKRRKRPPIYKVMLHNDDFNKREYVVQVLLKAVQGYTIEDALAVMQEAHQNGIALVTEASQDEAEDICGVIRRAGLICTIEPR